LVGPLVFVLRILCSAAQHLLANPGAALLLHSLDFPIGNRGVVGFMGHKVGGSGRA
jgi:hypothetical protein